MRPSCFRRYLKHQLSPYAAVDVTKNDEYS